ncbi:MULTISPECIES: hypothetical protein [Psychrilyobacter]|uniref:Uncharacterized protein n=1 Tax=Psychrilyobacter piezotolerans TaxID=2293438 RepID=A0ABX9KDR1_9FUSO|nr:MULTISPECIES: hypothetical protein [Psychrilyobacter]MCS5422431.1 hypothetical protein [Psychrilyobacter sp. S5]NDI79063.1 hypothetical protein [Psychrilyobacter piezotolerans]RDE59024.1 hypothetical protein DV867_14195 [Psychrilyobacter sp. S5]REI39601.1 hypothetical protein DYH56_14195 [Psychrilyobacter piezotolerans]
MNEKNYWSLLSKLGLMEQDLITLLNMNLGDPNEIREYIYMKAKPYTTFLQRVNNILGRENLPNNYKIFFGENWEENFQEELKTLFPFPYPDQIQEESRQKMFLSKDFELISNLAGLYSSRYNNPNELDTDVKRKLSQILYSKDEAIENIASLLRTTPRTIRNYINEK